MKKIITIITAFALCLTAFAKDINTLTSEYAAIVAGKAFSETEYATKAYVDENSNDLLKAFDSWKTSEYANKTFASDAYKKASADARKTMLIQTAMFARLYDYYHASMNANDTCVIYLCSNAIRFYPELYQRAKDCNWTYNGHQILEGNIFAVVHYFGDIEYLLTLPIPKSSQGMINYSRLILPYLLQMENASEAKAKCDEIENWFLVNAPESVYLKQASAISRKLTTRIAEAKLLGK